MKDSLRKKIITAVLASQLVLAVGLTAAIVLYSRVQFLSAFNIMLEGRANSMLATIHDADERPEGLILDRERLNMPAGDLLEVWDQNGTLIWRSANWSGAPDELIRGTKPTFELSKGTHPTEA